MKLSLRRDQFVNAFREIRPESFSDNGLRALFDLLEEYEEASGEELEFDAVAFDCSYSELSIDEFFSSYDVDFEGFDDERDAIEAYLDENGGGYRWAHDPISGAWSIVFWSEF